MKIVSFTHQGGARLGVCDGDTVVDLKAAAPDLPADLIALINMGEPGWAAVKKALASASPEQRRPLSSLALRPPIARPGKIICLGLNYVDHAAEGGHAKPTYPSFFMRGSTSLVAHGQPIRRPRVSTQLDYEAELVAVIGKTARNVKKERALDYVVGYSCFNEASIRDYQRKTAQWTIGKNFDGTGAFGPWMVTADELPPGGAGLAIRCRLNGQVMQDADTSDMIFPVDETIQLLTECLTLEPGDILVMGTPAGVGWARKPPVFMKAGDTVEIEIERIGVLRNPVAEEAS
ncbi:MAG: 5-oxopent-3-ene-1,2,5-tricarboxylate decarboxylase [Betaproteobacteria bacterium RIFCSPLOWO2_02_FULL_65_24]|nr:MAG: 5-oxopent-3-ene-1,2,5-tricarboxylate decarboxylase [Betaproteobacteria bacterium RIFCSPLOWO2_02_FULL_65_24]OGA96995.1 MAG: 5-oxopent-3-ene-1,2,5-tricarboxylate decarboxylase [Betaproteobacteria bacterium RIFCSPLOWO2_12_FULL_66_14]